MRLKTFTAPTMSEAMDLVRQDMGDEAIIVSTHKAPEGLSCRVTAAIEDDIPLDVALDTDEFDGDALEDYLRQVLNAHCLPPHMTERLIRAALSVDESDPALALAAAIDAGVEFRPIDMDNQTRPLILVGVPGAGKTITAAKLAAHAKFAGKTVVIATTDTKRAGGIEQLSAFTRILELELITATDATELAQHAQTIAGADITIVDTAGANPFSDDEMNALRNVIKACSGEPILVLPAGGDAMESVDTAAAFSSIGTERMIITRLDMTRRMGGILAAALGGSMAIANVSVNPQVADGLTRINPVSLTRLIIPDDETDQQPLKSKVSR